MRKEGGRGEGGKEREGTGMMLTLCTQTTSVGVAMLQSALAHHSKITAIAFELFFLFL